MLLHLRNSLTLCHHLLVTPIDWKPQKGTESRNRIGESHHLLAIAIDWKQHLTMQLPCEDAVVTTYW